MQCAPALSVSRLFAPGLTTRGQLRPAAGLPIARVRLKDAVPLRFKAPSPKFPVDVAIIGICPKAGSGILHLKWKTRSFRVLDRHWLVERGLPGEVVTLQFGVVKQKRFPVGDLEIMANPDVKKAGHSPYEVRPTCPHFDSCGGCDFLHLRYGRQLTEKQRWVQKVLVNAKVPLSVLARIRPSQPQLHYATCTKWILSEVEGEPRFRPSGRGPVEAGIEPPSGCMLPPRAATRALTAFYEAFRQERLSDRAIYSIFEEKRAFGTFRGAVAFCTQAPRREAGKRRTELLLNLLIARDVEDVAGVLGPLVQAVVAQAPKCLVGIVANVARSKRALMGGRRELLLHGRRYVRQALAVSVRGEMRQFVLEVGAGSRLHVHAQALPEVAQTVVEMCGVGETDVVWHCFCGGGELSLALGAACDHVVAIGTSAAEVSELKRNLAANEVSNMTAVLTNLRSPWTLKRLSFHIAHSQQKRLLLGTGEEQEKAREYTLSAFVPGESRRRQIQRFSAMPFTAPLVRQDALAHRELQVLLPAFVRDFRPTHTTLPVPVRETPGGEVQTREVPPEMESRLKRLYRRLALKYHPDKNPNDPEASERFQALTRAYKALVGDKAGPEEGDEDVEDPFLVAMASNYRSKFKRRWREEAQEEHQRSIRRTVKREKIETDEGQGDGEVEDELEEEDEEDEDLVVKMEIDEAWARPAATAEPTMNVRQDEDSVVPEVMLHEGEKDMVIDGDPVQMPTLPPPDVIVVSQPRARKAGIGTPRHFHSWLRSTAARAIIYIAADVGAFEADLKSLMGLGYGVTKVQPFDPEPHRRSQLLVARLELIKPLKGSEDYMPDGSGMIAGAPMLLPDGDGTRVPLLGGGGYAQIPAPR